MWVGVYELYAYTDERGNIIPFSEALKSLTLRDRSGFPINTPLPTTTLFRLEVRNRTATGALKALESVHQDSLRDDVVYFSHTSVKREKRA